MRLLKKLSIFFAGLVVVLIGIAFLLPDQAHVERSITIARPPSQVFTVLNGFRRFNDWSPWFDLDPQAKTTLSGPASGVGAKFSWAGNKDVGSGSQEIIESKPYEMLKIALVFGSMGDSTSTFRLTPADLGTEVSWSFDADFNGQLANRYFGLLIDSQIGKDYTRGLTRLKTLVERFPPVDIAGVQGEEVQRTAQKTYFISASSGNDPESAKAALTAAFARIDTFIKASGIVAQSAPLSITTSYDENSWKFDAAIPVDRNDVQATGDIKSGSTYSGKAVQFMHQGSYDKLAGTAHKAQIWIVIQGYKPKDRMIEEYLRGPVDTPPEQLQTRLVIPVE